MSKRNYDVYSASDYAGMPAGRFSFYVGYEVTICAEHGNNADCECDGKQWAFTASDNRKEVGRISMSEIGGGRDPMEELLQRRGFQIRQQVLEVALKQ